MGGPGELRRRVQQPRFYDFIVFSKHKRVEKLRHMHRNPVKRGLVLEGAGPSFRIKTSHEVAPPFPRYFAGGWAHQGLVHLVILRTAFFAIRRIYALLSSMGGPGELRRRVQQPRFYDFIVFSKHKRVEKLRYTHRNPVKRGLVLRPEQWPWSSFRHYAYGEPGPVAVNEPRKGRLAHPFESRLLTRLPHPSRVFAGRVGSGQEHDTHSFSPPCGPLRFDLDNAFRPRRIVNKTTPFPILRSLHQSSLDRIAMDVAQLLDAFRFAPYRKIVIADLPELRELFRAQLLRRDLLEHLYRHGQSRAFRFAEKQVHMLRHHHITRDVAAVPGADSLQFCLESIFAAKLSSSGIRR